MKNFSIIITLLTVLGISCNKQDLIADDDLSGSEYLRGRLFLTDMETKQAYGEPIKNRKILIQYASSSPSTNYLFSTTTDPKGYFVFQNLIKDKTYRIIFEDTMDGILYTSTHDTTPAIEGFQLEAKIDEKNQNGMILTLKDANGFGAIKDAKVFVFTSELLFNGGTSEGSIFTLTSNAQGKAFAFQLPSARYWLYATATINGVPLSAKLNFDTLLPKGIKRVDMQLKPTPIANSLQITTIDANGEIVPNAQLCFFTSSVLFRKDTCSGSNFQITSNADGKAIRASNFKDYYYVLGKKMIDSQRYLIGRDSFLLGDGPHVRNIILKDQ